MDYKEMNQVLAELDQAMNTLEDLYIEGEGEVTEETERMEERISALKDLLTGEGIDLLGGWLKAKEDRKKALKAEKDYLTRQMSAIDETIEFIKDKITEVMRVTGQDKIKGERGYSFTATHSVKTEVDKDVLKDKYGFRVEQIMRGLGIPEYIGFSLTASTTKAKEVGVQEGDEEIFVTNEKDTVTFRKPKASKEA
jgi:prefoldin subunit 5